MTVIAIFSGIDDGAQTLEDYRLLKDAGVQFQRNLGTLEGMYGEAVCVRAEALDAEEMYDWVGSDLHNRKYAHFFDQYVFGKQ